MNPSEIAELERSIERMTNIAREFGLQFPSMRYELVPADVLYTFGAYQGMPTRFSHWSFGKADARLHKTHAEGGRRTKHGDRRKTAAITGIRTYS